MRDLLLYVTIVLNIVALVGMVAGILMHSGRGGGLSDMFGGGVSTNLGGSSTAERNLDRITVAIGVTWGLCIVALGLLLKSAN